MKIKKENLENEIWMKNILIKRNFGKKKILIKTNFVKKKIFRKKILTKTIYKKINQFQNLKIISKLLEN